MKKAEVITLLCGLFGVAGIVLYLSFSSRLARAENESRKARDLVATMQQNETNRATAQTAPIRFDFGKYGLTTFQGHGLPKYGKPEGVA
jgi:hypothetical protein